MADLKSLGRYRHESRLLPEQRIYVNRNLRMANIRAIGFDLDHTLAHYRGPAVEELAYRLARQRLVERFGYPERLLDIPYDRNFVIRGLVIDKRRGNVLKMDYHNYVSRGFHGFRLLKPGERKTVYRSGRIRMGSGPYVAVDTLFHIPEVYLYLVLVDLLGKGKKRKTRSFSRIFDDVRESIDSVHADGTLKHEIVGHLNKYIRKDPRLVPTLRELSRVGKKLFLLTNSELYYTDALFKYLVSARGKPVLDWRSLFGLIVVDAGKPSFFTSQKGPGRRLKNGASCPVYRAGDARALEKRLGFSGDQILYFGDHTYGDILRSKKSVGWRTAMVVEELKEELDVSARVQPQLEELNHWKALRGVMEGDLSSLEIEHRKVERRLEAMNGGGPTKTKLKHRLGVLDRKLTRVLSELDSVQRMTADLGDSLNESYNSQWGPLFREGSEMSRFGHQVKDFACIYMTRVSNLLYYDVNHYFRSAAERMPHEWT